GSDVIGNSARIRQCGQAAARIGAQQRFHQSPMLQVVSNVPDYRQSGPAGAGGKYIHFESVAMNQVRRQGAYRATQAKSVVGKAWGRRAQPAGKSRDSQLPA